MYRKIKLKDIADITSGSNAPKDKDFTITNSGIPFVRAGHLESLIEGMDINELPKVDEIISKRLKLKKASKNAILFAKSGMSCKKNRIYKLKEEAYFVNHLAAVTVKSDEVNVDYLKYFLVWFKPSTLIRDESYPSIRLSDISEIELFLPSIVIQNRIAKILNLVTDLINYRQQQIEALSELKTSIFLDMFGDPIINDRGWETKTLGELGEWKSGGTPSRSKPHYFKGNIPWLSSGELNNIYVSESKEYITEKAIKESSAKIIPINSLLLGMYDTAGLKSSINKVICSCNQAVAFAQLNEQIVSTEFVYYTIQLMRDYLLTQQRGVRQKNFNLKMIKNIEIILPPLEMQKQFTEKLIKLVTLEEKLTKTIINLNKLFNNLLNKSFSGELFKEETIKV